MDIIEQLTGKKLTAKEVLLRIGFAEKDFIKIKDNDITNIVKNKDIAGFLLSRKNLDMMF